MSGAQTTVSRRPRRHHSGQRPHPGETFACRLCVPGPRTRSSKNSRSSSQESTCLSEALCNGSISPVAQPSSTSPGNLFRSAVSPRSREHLENVVALGAPRATSAQAPQKVIVDTDFVVPPQDDSMALILALKSPEDELFERVVRQDCRRGHAAHRVDQGAHGTGI